MKVTKASDLTGGETFAIIKKYLQKFERFWKRVM